MKKQFKLIQCKQCRKVKVYIEFTKVKSHPFKEGVCNKCINKEFLDNIK